MSLYRTALSLVGQYLVGDTTGLASAADTSKAWRYTTKDAAAVVETANYFLGAYDLLKKGDTIQSVMAFGGTPVVKQYVVTVCNSTTVTIVLQQTTAG